MCVGVDIIVISPYVYIVSTREAEMTGIMDPAAWEAGRERRIKANATAGRNKRWIAEDETRKEIEAFCLMAAGGSEFIANMRDALHEWGRLTENQEAAVRKAMARAEKREVERNAEWEAAADCPEGRVEVTGVILSVDIRETAFGSQWKMLVRDDSGFKVWGSIPQKLKEQTETFLNHQFFDGTDLKGKRVSFIAAITPSKDDQKFGFLKRPTKAKLED